MSEEQTNNEQSNQMLNEDVFVQDAISDVDEENSSETAEQGVLMSILMTIVEFFRFIGRTTVTFFKQLPHTIATKYKAKVAEYRRMPKRRSINKVYVLVGYTTKEYVDRKFRKERILLSVRKILVACIVLLVLIMAWRWIYPKLDTEEYKQMIGINEMGELTKNDPFATESTTIVIAPESQEVTPIPTNTTSPVESTSQEPV